MTIEMINCQATILHEIGNKPFKRKHIALTYAFCLRASESVDFALVNSAIIERWSVSGLIYIKELAWAYVEGRKSP